MGQFVLILGESGTGKSYSLRNFKEGEVGIFNVLGKRLPFRENLATANTRNYETIKKGLRDNSLKAYVIDDANYLMQMENFELADTVGYGKFTNMAVHFQQMLKAITEETSDDTIVYVMMHTDVDDSGRTKPKTIGKMLDNQLTIEGMSPIVIGTVHDGDGYGFVTQGGNGKPYKSPPGMFDERIDNDLKAVDTAIREYWGM